MSPTTFDDGVTFTMSPNPRLTSAYVRAISGHRSPSPIASACSLRFVYCPPGISCKYTSAVPELGAVDQKLLWPEFNPSWPTAGPNAMDAFTPMGAWGVPAVNTLLLLT